jgi:hypothetical protein
MLAALRCLVPQVVKKRYRARGKARIVIAEKDVSSRSSLGDFFELFDPDYQFRSFVFNQMVPR